MNDTDIIDLYKHHVRVLQEKVETQALHIAEQNVLLDEMIDSAQSYMRWKLYLQVFVYVTVAVLAMFGMVHYWNTPAVDVIEKCTKFEGLGFKTEICNTTSWTTIVMVLVLIIGTYAGVKYIDRLRKEKE